MKSSASAAYDDPQRSPKSHEWDSGPKMGWDKRILLYYDPSVPVPVGQGCRAGGGPLVPPTLPTPWSWNRDPHFRRTPEKNPHLETTNRPRSARPPPLAHTARAPAPQALVTGTSVLFRVRLQEHRQAENLIAAGEGDPEPQPPGKEQGLEGSLQRERAGTRRAPITHRGSTPSGGPFVTPGSSESLHPGPPLRDGSGTLRHRDRG